MKRHSIVAFDDYIALGTAGGVLVFSTDKYAARLAIFDQIALELTAEMVPGSATPTIQVNIQTSADGIHWVYKADAAEIGPTVLDPQNASPMLGFDDGSRPSLRLIRFAIAMNQDTAAYAAKVRLVATTNDAREGLFARRMRALIHKQNSLDNCEQVIPGGAILPRRPGSWGDLLIKSKKHQYIKPDPFVASGYMLAENARVCVLRGGGIIVERQGHGSLELKPETGSNKGAC